MKFSTFLVSFVFSLSGVQAWSQKHCLSDADAAYIVNGEATVLRHTDLAVANATAQAIYAENLLVLSDSINSLYAAPLGTPIYTDRETYIEDTLSQPGAAAVNTLDITHDCYKISWHWEFLGVGSGEYRIRGFTLFTVDENHIVIEEAVEFNTIAWGLDIGFTVTMPPQ